MRSSILPQYRKQYVENKLMQTQNKEGACKTVIQVVTNAYWHNTMHDNKRVRHMRINIVLQMKQMAADTNKIESNNDVLDFYEFQMWIIAS